MKKTLVVNLIAGSGAGKSTNASRLFTMLKDLGIEVELVTEYVKDMVWEGRNKIFECQPYIFGKQLYRLVRVEDKVDVIITDRPILLDMVYDPEQDEDFRKYILKKFNQFDNLNIYLNRVKPFSPKGRNETTIEQAKEYDEKVLSLLEDLKVPYIKIDGNEEGCQKILRQILNRLEEKEINFNMPKEFEIINKRETCKHKDYRGLTIAYVSSCEMRSSDMHCTQCGKEGSRYEFENGLI